MIRDLVVFNFQGQGQPLRVFINQVFSTAKFLQYELSDQELVARVVMNFHPDILAHAAFIDRPRTIKELYQAVEFVEEKLAVAQERQRLQPAGTSGSGTRGAPRSGPARPAQPLNVGTVETLVTLDVTAPVGDGRRETGRRPEDDRPPGAHFKWSKKGGRRNPGSFVVGGIRIQDRQGASPGGHWRPIFLYSG